MEPHSVHTMKDEPLKIGRIVHLDYDDDCVAGIVTDVANGEPAIQAFASPRKTLPSAAGDIGQHAWHWPRQCPRDR